MVGLRRCTVILALALWQAIPKKAGDFMKESFNLMRFSKKVIIFTLGATLLYAVVYMVLCFSIGQLPDYSFNVGLFAALSAENLCNAWIKICEHKYKNNGDSDSSGLLLGDEEDGVPNHPNDMTGENVEDNVGG